MVCGDDIRVKAKTLILHDGMQLFPMYMSSGKQSTTSIKGHWDQMSDVEVSKEEMEVVAGRLELLSDR